MSKISSLFLRLGVLCLCLTSPSFQAPVISMTMLTAAEVQQIRKCGGHWGYMQQSGKHQYIYIIAYFLYVKVNMFISLLHQGKLYKKYSNGWTYIPHMPTVSYEMDIVIDTGVSLTRQQCLRISKGHRKEPFGRQFQETASALLHMSNHLHSGRWSTVIG